MRREFKRPQKLMGNAFEITVVSDDEKSAYDHIDAAIAEIQRIENGLDQIGVKAASVFRHGVDRRHIAVHDGEAVLHIRDVLPVCFRNGACDHAAVVAEVERRRVVIRAARHKAAHNDQQENERREDGGDDPAHGFAELFAGEDAGGDLRRRCRRERHQRPPALPNSFSLYAGA